MSSVLLISLMSFFLLSCTGGENQTNVELIQDMMNQKNIKSGEDMRQPPEHTVPRGYKPYPYRKEDVDKAAKTLKNPIYNVRLASILLLGKKQYDFQCAVCHGQSGRGDGPVGVKMILKPPSLLTQKIREWEDGRIFHVITRGQGVMGSYLTQIPKEKDRWAVVNYIRNLQRINKE